MNSRSCAWAPLLSVLSACAGTPPTFAPEDVRADGHLIAEYRHEFDPGHFADTCKVYHRVFAPDGVQITKDLGGEYPHHRGVFLGFNQLAVRGAHWDFWHCHHGESQRHVAFAAPSALGLTGDWQVSSIEWRAGDGRVVVQELRAVHAEWLARGREPVEQLEQLDCVCELRANDVAVRLDGDPQHSGFQFRATEEFEPAGAPKVHYVYPAGAAGGVDDIWTGCDWVAQILPFANGPITVLHLDASTNPRPNRYSTRDYGRFGSTFTADLQPGTPLRLHYRFVIAMGELTRADCERFAAEFAKTAGR